MSTLIPSDASSSAASTTAMSLVDRIPSRLHEIILQAQEKMRRIDDLERRLEERAMRARRRICNIIDTFPGAQNQTFRSSHLRCFLTHSCHEENASGTAPPSTSFFAPPKNLWVLRFEGRLLIGHLDHASAAARDKATGYVPPTDDLDRSKGEKEETEEMVPVQFTHFFDRIQVEFQTTYSPRPNPMAKKKPPAVVAAANPGAASSSSKKRRGSNNNSNKPTVAQPEQDENAVDPKLLVTSTSTTFVWNKKKVPPSTNVVTTAHTVSGEDHEDANCFDFHYLVPDPPEPRYQIHTVVAQLKIQPCSTPKDPLYAISSVEMAREFFPKHVMESSTTSSLDDGEGAGAGDDADSKKRKHDDGTPSNLPPMEDDIQIPDGLTMKQIVMAFFTYIHDRKLCHETDKSTVVCNEQLKTLLGGMESFPFSGLQQLLITRNLIRPLYENYPVQLTYVMKEEASTNYQIPNEQQQQLASAAAPDPEYQPVPSQLQFDMDVTVPALFPFRAREILRRIKRRELEYTSARTKARYLLMSRRAKDEEDVKAVIDQVVSGHHYGTEYVPVFHALAKAAPPHTEARQAAHVDARLSYLLPKVQEHVASAHQAWGQVASSLHRLDQKIFQQEKERAVLLAEEEDAQEGEAEKDEENDEDAPIMPEKETEEDSVQPMEE